MKKKNIHIALDLDKTLFYHESKWGISKIGDPIPKMVERVKGWINKGHRISIFTARACPFAFGKDRREESERQKTLIHEALEKAGLPKFDVTCMKSPSFTHFIDDRAHRVIANTGEMKSDEQIGL